MQKFGPKFQKPNKISGFENVFKFQLSHSDRGKMVVVVVYVIHVVVHVLAIGFIFLVYLRNLPLKFV